MRYIRATYSPEKETCLVNDVTHEQHKYWKTQDGVNDLEGVWDNEQNIFIPDGLFDDPTGYLKLI